jgi:hypothetical protein
MVTAKMPTRARPQRMLHLVLRHRHALRGGVDQAGGLGADRVHVLLAHVRHQHELPGVLVALLAHAHRQVHLGRLALHVATELGQRVVLVRAVGIGGAQRVQVVVDLRKGRVVRLQVARVAGEQVAALAGLGVQHVLHQAVEFGAGLVVLLDFGQRLARLLVAGLVDADEHTGREQGKDEVNSYTRYGERTRPFHPSTSALCIEFAHVMTQG